MVFDDGTGPALFVLAANVQTGSGAIRGIGKWDGESWSPLGNGLDRFGARTAAVFDDGTGPALYVAGDFETAGGVSARNIAKWDGTAWSALGNAIRLDETVP